MLASIIAPEMTDNLRNILEHAEGLGMPDGDYLRVANALRDAFNAVPAPGVAYRPRHRYTNARPVRVSIYDSHRIPISIELISQTRTDAGPGRPDTIHCVYQYNATGGERTTLSSSGRFSMVVRDFLFQHQPREVKITTDIGSYVAKYHIEEKRNAREVKQTIERLKIEGLPEERKEQLEEHLSDIVYFCYGDFLNEVIRRIPDSENIQYL